MLRFVCADWIRVSRYWLTWALLALLILILMLQVNAKLNEIEAMQIELKTGVSASDNSALTPEQIEARGLLFDFQLQELRYPAFIGTAARLSTGPGWFIVIIFTAVMGGEDFGRRTLVPILARGVRRSDYLLARTLVLWLAAGAAVVVITSLAVVAGPFVHTRVSDDPISLSGLGEALLWVLRCWVTYLPFIVATLFWAVLARNAGPALGLGVGLRAFESLIGFVIPVLASILTLENRAEVPFFFSWMTKLFSVTLGYNADVFLNWGSPYHMDPILIATALGPGDEKLLPATPWRATMVLVVFIVLFQGWSIWILRHRDLTYES
jgi:ABC-type transport system involved in multi-copper enzyme maturation permease subunit